MDSSLTTEIDSNI